MLMRRLFGSEVAVAEMDPRDAKLSLLLPEEQSVIAAAAAKRKLEFAAGRQLARSVLGQIGIVEPVALLPDEKRAPCWPMGTVGTISHTDGWAVAAAAKASDVCSLGCDVEVDSALDHELWPLICTEDELAWLNTQVPSERASLAKLIFSAKECTYKAQYPLTHCMMDFADLCVDMNLVSGCFQAQFRRPVARFRVGDALTGSFLRERGFIATALTVLQ